MLSFGKLKAILKGVSRLKHMVQVGSYSKRNGRKKNMTEEGLREFQTHLHGFESTRLNQIDPSVFKLTCFSRSQFARDLEKNTERAKGKGRKC